MKLNIPVSIITAGVAVFAHCHAADFTPVANEHIKITRAGNTLVISAADSRPVLKVGAIVAEHADGTVVRHEPQKIGNVSAGSARITYADKMSLTTRFAGNCVFLDIWDRATPNDSRTFLVTELGDGITSASAFDYVKWRRDDWLGDTPEKAGTLFTLEGARRPVWIYNPGRRATASDTSVDRLRLHKGGTTIRLRFGESVTKREDTATVAAICADDLQIEFSTDRPRAIFKPGETPRCDITVRNTVREARDVTFAWTARDYGGKVVKEGGEKVSTFKFGATKTFAVTLPPAPRESYLVEMRVTLNGREYRRPARVTVWDDAMKVPADSKFGIADFCADTPAEEAELAAIMRRLGARGTFHNVAGWTREKYAALELNPAEEKDGAKTRAVAESPAEQLRRLRADGITRVYFRAIISPGGKNRQENNRQADAIAAELVARLREYDAVRKAEMPGMQFHVHATGYLSALVWAGAKDIADAVSYRYFPNSWDAFQKSFGQMLADANWFDMPFSLMSFYPHPVALDNGDADIEAALFVQMMRLAANPRFDSAAYFMLQDGAPAYYDGCGEYAKTADAQNVSRFRGRGLLRESCVNGGEAAPALLAYQFAAMLAAETSDHTSGVYQNGLYAMRFDYRRKLPSAMLFLNNKLGAYPDKIDDLKYDDEKPATRRLTFAAAAPEVIVCDVIGRKTKVRAVNGRVTLDITERPVVVFGIGSLIE